MNKIKSLVIVAALFVAASIHAQTINVTNIVGELTTNVIQVTALDNAINALGLNITNYSIDPYGTYAPQAPKGSSKFGGGLLALYNFNQNASAGIGIDWLGQFSLVSGNLELKAPFHLDTVLTFLESSSAPKLIQDIGAATITPFALGGVGTSYSGNGHFNGSPMVIADVGGAFSFAHLWGGEFNAGLAWGAWEGSGPYGGVKRYHAFLGYQHGF